MDNKLLLTKCITLLYRESLITEKSDTSADQVRTVLEQMQLPTVDLSVNHERDTLVSLKQTALEMCENDRDHIYEKIEILQRLKMNCQDDNILYETLAQGIEPEMSVSGNKNSVIAMRKALQTHFRDQKTAEVLKKASLDFQFKREGIKNVKQWIGEIIAQLEPFQMDVNLRDPAIIREVDLSDAVGVAAAFNDVKDMDNGKGILQTGWQDVNDMLQGGIRDSDTVCIGALQHKYKTGFTLTLFKQICLYNTPILRDPTKKPLLLRISFEDTVEMNLQFLYQSLMENETGQKANIKNKTGEEIGQYVYERLQATGFHVKLLEVDPTKWSYLAMCNYILDLESQGYEVKLLMVDYLNMLPKTGCTQGAMGDDIRDLYRRTRNFLKVRRIPFVTPHQLSSEAKRLLREDRPDFVKVIAEKGYWDGCSRLDQELDVELYIHIEKLNKKSYLTIQRGKHRIPTVIPDSKKYIVLPFMDIGGIPDDIGKTRIGASRVGGGAIGSGDEVPWWEANSQV